MSEVKTLTITEFLLARIAEDESVALRLCPGRKARNGHWRVDSFMLASVLAMDPLAARHIARHDPARVLAECEAKRRIVEEHPDYGGYGESCARCAESSIDLAPWPCPTLRALASVWSDHPDYREEWRP
jgi:hypothetical protein